MVWHYYMHFMLCVTFFSGLFMKDLPLTLVIAKKFVKSSVGGVVVHDL